MKMKHSIAFLLIAATLLAVCATTALAQSAPVLTNVTIPPSSVANAADLGLRAHTNIRILGSGPLNDAPQFVGPPFPGYFYETPASIACIYGLQPSSAGCNPNVVTANPSGGSRAIAIVDAFDDPNAYIDLQAFSVQFGVAAITPSSFQVVFAPFGGAAPGSCTAGPAPQPPSAAPTGWDFEESLDIEWAHSMAPHARLYLVEAQSNSFSDLLCAVSVASTLVRAAGGGQVSMSWAGGEWPGETAIDPVFTTSRVVYFASAGDGSGAVYPSVSPNVVSVGGTSLSTNAITGSFEVENTWQDTGGGPSVFESRPSYQNGISAVVGGSRGTPDVAAVANPSTGVWVLDTLVYGPGSWFVFGGTSVASPLWAGFANAAGGFASSSRAALNQIYSGQGPFRFTDITIGNCGLYASDLATAGWDFCSGFGSPKPSPRD